MSLTDTRRSRTWPGILTQEEARRRAEAVSDVRYELTLDLTGEDSTRSESVIRFRADETGETFLDYAGDVVSVVCNGGPLPPDCFDGTRITIPVADGDNHVQVTGTAPYGRTGVGMHRFRDPADGQLYLHTKFQPFDAHRVFPCFDQPNLKGRFTFEVTAPASWQVVSNTAAVEVTTAGAAKRWRFAPSLPLSPYLATVAAGPFAHVGTERDGVPMTLYARPSLMDALTRDAGELFDITAEGLAFFADQFGHPYPFGKYDLVFAPEYNFGAMEHPGAVTANERFLFTSRVTQESRRRRSEVLLHEMAHMWFGNLVTPRWWNDLWLSESFAVWAAATAQAATERYAAAWVWFAHDAEVIARRADQLSGGQPVAVEAPDTMAARLVFNPITYRKGAALLRQLAAELGHDRFLRGLRRYLDTYAWGNAGFAELIAALEDGTGDVRRWSRWLQQPGVGAVTTRRLATGFEVYQSSGPQAGERTCRVDVGVYDAAGGTLRDRATVTLSGATVRCVDADLSSGALVLPNDTAAAYTKVVLDPVSRHAALDRLSNLADPLARAVAWSALWDDVHDGRLPARMYVRCVLRHARVEPDDGVMELLWERAIDASLTYGAPDHRVRALADIFSAAADELAAAEPGSDRQMVWARMLLATLPAEEMLPVDQVLRGESPWPGLDVDADLRWRLLRRLAVLGASRHRIDPVLAADQSWEGHCRALAVHAAQPDPESKQEAWRLAFDDSRSLAERQAVMTGFRQPTQEELLQPYARRYFDALPALWAGSEREFAIAVTRLLYPRLPTAEAWVLDRTDAMLDGDTLPVEAHRILREERAFLVAVTGARACDAEAGRGAR